MATVQDTLQTLLRLVGGKEYGKELEGASKSLEKLAAAEEKQKDRGQALQGALRAVGLESLTAGGAALAGAALVRKAVDTFAEDEQQIFRTTIVLRNLGNSYPIEKAQAFASAIQRTVAIDDEAVVGLIGLEKQFGVTDAQLESTAKTIIDFSKGARISLSEAAEDVLRGMIGVTKGLRGQGIQMTDTGNKAKNLAIIMQKVNGIFGGSGEAERNTLTGTFTALKESLANLLSAVGDKISTVLVPALNVLIRVTDLISQHPVLAGAGTLGLAGAGIGRLFGPQGALIGGGIGALIGAVIGALPSRANAAASVGNGKEKLATEATLAQIEQNTAKTAEAFVKGILGGPGTIARAAFTARDAKLAFGV